MPSKSLPVLLSPLLLAAAAELLSAAPAPQPPPPPSPAATPQPIQPPQSQPAETKDQKDTRMQWWREARFGMFIHWGLYCVPAGVYKNQNVDGLGEWIMNNAAIPVADYAQFANQFNPSKFNADNFVAIAKAAGMKYIVITAKHHDGFAMFKSADPFNIVDSTPFKRDIIKELDDAARKAGIRFGVYYSQSQDWHHPGGYALANQTGTRRPAGTHWDPAAQDGSFDDYLKNVALAQTKELLTHYKLDILWWDTPGSISLAQATPFHDLLKLQPSIITNNRLMNTKAAGAFTGDTETPEQNIPANGYPGGRDWETCMTINRTWGYKSTDTDFKTTETLLRNLIDIASKGGNYLLNVGPTAEGLIPEPEIQRLSDMGKWLDINGEAIYGTKPNPFPAAGPATTAGGGRAPVVWNWRATSKLDTQGNGKIYIHIFQWPTIAPITNPNTNMVATPAFSQFMLPPIPNGGKITKAYLLADPKHEPLNIAAMAAGAESPVIMLPQKAPDPIASVVVLEIHGKQ